MTSPITFCGESAGGVAVRFPKNPKPETTGGIGIIYEEPNDEIKCPNGTKDEVCFRSKDNSNGEKSVLPALAAITFTAAGIIAALGCAKRYNWVDKIGNAKVKDFVTKYGTDPCYDACQYIKTKTIAGYNKVVDFFKGKNK